MAKAQPSPQEGSGLGERSHPEPQWEWGYKWVTCNQFPTHCLFPSSHRVKLSKSFPGLHNKASSLSGAVSSAHRSAKGAQLYPFLYRVPRDRAAGLKTTGHNFCLDVLHSIIILVNYYFCTGGLFLPSFTLTAVGSPLQSLHHPGSIRHRNLNPSQLHYLVERKIQTEADLENISDVFIISDSDFPSTWTSHENCHGFGTVFKMPPPLKCSLFSFKTKFTGNS